MRRTMFVAFLLVLVGVALCVPKPVQAEVPTVQRAWVNYLSTSATTSPVPEETTAELGKDIKFRISWDPAVGSGEGTVAITAMNYPFFMTDPWTTVMGFWYKRVHVPESARSYDMTMTPILSWDDDYSYRYHIMVYRLEETASVPVAIWGAKITPDPQAIYDLSSNFTRDGTVSLGWWNWNSAFDEYYRTPGQGGPIGRIVVAAGRGTVVPSHPATSGVNWQTWDLDGAKSSHKFSLAPGSYYNLSIWRVFEGRVSQPVTKRVAIGVKPKVSIGGYSRRRVNRAYTLSGRVSPAFKGTVTVTRWKRSGGKWVKQTTSTRKIYSGKYTWKPTLRSRGKYRFRARFNPADSQSARSYSVYKYVTVY